MATKCDRRQFLIGTATTAGLSALSNASLARGNERVRITGLRVEHVDRPLGVDNPRPQLSWRLASEERNVSQSAYRIIVSSTEARARALDGDLWDTGKVPSNRSFGVDYQGHELASRQRCWWRVQVWDERRDMSAPSAISEWEMGLLHPSDWTAQWIAVETAFGKQDREFGLRWIWGEPSLGESVRKFRCRFTLSTASRSGELYALVNDWRLWSQITRIWLDGVPIAGSGEWSEAIGQAELSVHQLTLPPLSAGEHLLCVEVRTSEIPRLLSNTDLKYGLAVLNRFHAEGSGPLRMGSGLHWKTSLTENNDWYGWDYDDSGWEGVRLAPIEGYQPMPLQPAMYLRRDFNLGKRITVARLYATSLGAYEARINGKRVSDALLVPEISQYAKRVLYRVYDVTSMLRRGGNTVGFIVGDGWYGSFDGRFSWAPPPRRLLAQLEIEYADGSVQTVATGPDWRISESPIRHSEMKVGEVYDARLEQPGWDSTGFDADSWGEAELATPPSCILSSQISPPIRVTEILRPVSISEPRPGIYVVDFGQNFSGWCRLRTQGSRGAQVALKFAELLGTSREIDQPYMNTGLPKQDVYILRGDKQDETFEPRFSYRGFRYVQIVGLAERPSADSIEGMVVHSDLQPTGRLRVAAPLIEQIWRSANWTYRSCYVGIPADTPSREQRCWLNTSSITWDSVAYAMDICALTSRHMDNIADEQRADGSFTMVSPQPRNNSAMYHSPGSPPGYGDTSIILPWVAWQRYGDLAIIRKHWNVMNRYLEFIRQHNPDYVWRTGRGLDWFDWLGLDQLTVHNKYPITPKDLIGTAYWAHSARLLAQMAEAVGFSVDARRLHDIAGQVRKAFGRNFVTSQSVVGNGTQSSYVLALHFDLLESEARQRAAEHLANDIRSRGVSLTTGTMGAQFVLDVLVDTGYPELAFSLLLRDEYPSWGCMIRNGATTIWESWSGGQEVKTADGQTKRIQLGRNHAELASMCGFLFRRVAGIDVGAPGFANIIVCPALDARIKSGGGDYDSVLGRISTDWQRHADGRFSLDVTIPANATARIHIPASPNETVQESRLPVSGHRDIQLIQRSDRELVLGVGSGTYAFVVG